MQLTYLEKFLQGWLQRTESRGLTRNAMMLVGIMMLVMLVTAIVITVSVYKSRQGDLRNVLRHELTTELYSATYSFNQSYGMLMNHVQGAAESNIVRLLVMEQGAADVKKSLVTALKGMVSQGAVRSGLVVDENFVPLGYSHATPPSLTKPQVAAMEKIRKDKLSHEVLSATLNGEGQLVFDIIFPIFPPLYDTSRSNKVVGYLLAQCSIKALLEDYFKGNTADHIRMTLLQPTDEGLQLLYPAQGKMSASVSPWSGPSRTKDMFAMTSPSGTKMLAVMVDLPGSPWDLVAQMPQSILDDKESRLFWLIILVAFGCVCGGFLALVVVWWVLVGEKAKAVAAELHSLYATVNAQGQLLGNINTAIRDGIVLTDAHDTIHYVNDAFARMVSKEPRDLLSQRFGFSAGVHTNLPINPYRQKTLHEGATLTFTETITNGGTASTYRVGCAPYRNASGRVEGVVSVYCDITEILYAQEESKARMRQVIQVLVQSIEMIDPYLSGQSLLTAKLCHILGHQMGLDTKDIGHLLMAAELSRIGTTRLPHELRTKQEAYTPEEMKQVEKHVEYARDMLAGMNFEPTVQQIIYEMHENMDGTGYPRGLKGEKINPLSRTLAVANTFCAVLRPRGYRTRMELGKALEILSSSSYDQEIVRVLRAFVASPEGMAFINELVGG